MLTAIAGVNWGDEGKGRMVDLLSADYDIICRYQGGNNAGHTVVNDKGTFVLNLLPSGVLREDTVNVMGCGMVLDLAHLCGELQTLADKGVTVTPDNLKISDRAFVCFPYHKSQDILEEERLGNKKFGSTRRGIAPAYGDKYMKKGLRMGDLLDNARLTGKLADKPAEKLADKPGDKLDNKPADKPVDKLTEKLADKPADKLADKLADILAWKDLTLRGYGAETDSLAETLRWLAAYGERLLPYVTDTSDYLENAVRDGKNILFEAQLGSLRDIDYGIYPYTTSSQTLAAYAPIGAGIPAARLDRVIGVMKAYSSCVGEGPFTAELFGTEARALREAGAEYGAATGRPRRVGGFDIPASRYGVRVQGADALAVTKLDVLSYLEKIPVCVAYEIDGVKTDRFPTGERLARAKPIYEYWDGFGIDIAAMKKCRKPEDLPDTAVRYLRFIEKAVGCPIQYVSVGAGREDYLLWE